MCFAHELMNFWNLEWREIFCAAQLLGNQSLEFANAVL